MLSAVLFSIFVVSKSQLLDKESLTLDTCFAFGDKASLAQQALVGPPTTVGQSWFSSANDLLTYIRAPMFSNSNMTLVVHDGDFSGTVLATESWMGTGMTTLPQAATYSNKTALWNDHYFTTQISMTKGSKYSVEFTCATNAYCFVCGLFSTNGDSFSGTFKYPTNADMGIQIYVGWPSSSPSLSTSPSASESASGSQSQSASQSQSLSTSASQSQTVSASISASQSESASMSQSQSGSQSPSLSATESPSQSLSSSVSQSQSISPSNSNSQTESPSASLSTSPNPSPSPSPTHKMVCDADIAERDANLNLGRAKLCNRDYTQIAKDYNCVKVSDPDCDVWHCPVKIPDSVQQQFACV